MLILTLTPDLGPERVTALMRSGDVAAVVLRPVPDGGGDAARIQPVVEAIQAEGAAALVDGAATFVAAAGLDGVHVDSLAAVAAAVRTLKPQGIVGAGGLASRHEAMEAGEAGADYVLFGPLAPAAGSFPRTLDLIDWWAELFEVPCVGIAETLDEAEALATAGADFVALSEAMLAGPDGPAIVAAAQARLASAGGAG